MKNFLVKLMAGWLISLFLVQPAVAAIDFSATPSFTLSPAELLNSEDLDLETNPLGSGEPQDAEQALEQERQEDQKRCEEELGLNSLASKVGSLPNLLTTGLVQQFPATIGQYMTERLPTVLQNQITSALPSILESGLQGALPGYVNNAISQLVRDGLSSQAISSQLPNILNLGVAELTPQILNRELPRLIQGGVRDSMPSYLGESFRAQIPSLLANNPEFMGRINEAIKLTVEQSNDAASQARGEVEDQIDQIRSNSGVIGLFTFNPPSASDLNDTRLDQGDQTTLATGVLNGVSETAATAVAQSPELANISRTLAPVIAQLLNQQILPQILNTFQGGFNEAGGRIGRSDTTLMGLVGNNYDFSRGVLGDEIFMPVVHDMTPAFEAWGGSVASNLGTAIKYDIPLVKVSEFNSIGNNPTLQVNPEAASAIGINPGDQVIMPKDLTPNIANTANQAGSAVNAQSSSIAQGAFSQQSLDNLSNSFKLAGADVLSGTLGGLVGGIPYVGGIAGPLVQSFTSGFLNELFGVGATGMPVSDAGTQSGVQNVGKTTGKIESNTKTSNENEKQLQKTQDKALEIAIQACTHAKALERMQKKQEEARFVYDREARKKAWTSFATMFDTWLKSSGKSYNVSGVPNAEQGQNGQSIIADYKDNIDRAGAEAETRSVEALKQSGNLYAEEAAKAIVATRAETLKNPRPSTITQSQIEVLNNPGENDPNLVRESYLAFTEPQNNPRGVLIENYERTLNEISRDQTEARDRFVAYQGFNETRQCNGWLPDDNGQMQCVSWTTLTPGSTNGGQLLSFLSSPQRWLENSDQVGEDFVTDVISGPASVGTNVRGATSEGLPSAGVSSQSLCPGPGPCQETGYTPQASGNTAVSQAIDNGLTSLSKLNANKKTTGGTSGSTLPNFNLSDILNLIPAVEINEFSFEETTQTLSWSASNTFLCKTGNAWAGSSYQAGSNLTPAGGEKGSVVLSLPTQHSLLTYTLVCTDPISQTQDTAQVTIPATTP